MSSLVAPSLAIESEVYLIYSLSTILHTVCSSPLKVRNFQSVFTAESTTLVVNEIPHGLSVARRDLLIIIHSYCTCSLLPLLEVCSKNGRR